MCDSLSASHPADESLIMFTLYLLMNLKCSDSEDSQLNSLFLTVPVVLMVLMVLMVLLKHFVFTGLSSVNLSQSAGLKSDFHIF